LENLGKLIYYFDWTIRSNFDETNFLSNLIFFQTVPTARAIPSRDGREQLISDDAIEDVRGARLNVGSGSSNRNPNFATKIMSNGVEVLVASK
jgi:hypothetical protein